MNLEIKKLLQDIIDSVVLIETYIQNVQGLSAYKNDTMIVDAVERRLAIIGEAMWKIDKENKLISISNKKKIISLRHILVHDYDLVEDETIWVICKKYLPILKVEVQSILNVN